MLPANLAAARLVIPIEEYVDWYKTAMFFFLLSLILRLPLQNAFALDAIAHFGGQLADSPPSALIAVSPLGCQRQVLLPDDEAGSFWSRVCLR